MAEVILVVAVNKAGVKSEPMKMYKTADLKLPKQFVLKLLDAGTKEDGFEQKKLSNFKLKLVGTHGSDYLDEKLTGFRRKQDDDVFVVCEQYSEHVASLKDLKDSEEF